MFRSKVFHLFLTVVVTFMLLFSAVPTARADANDSFASATQISALPFADTIYFDDKTGEETDPTPSCGWWGRGRTAWYTFSPASDMMISADLYNAWYGVDLSVYQLVNGGLSFTGCSGHDDPPVIFYLTGGETYYFMINMADWGYYTPVGLQVVEIFPPANDNFANAYQIQALPFHDSQDSAAATLEDGEPQPSCAPMERTIWYAFTPTITDQYMTIVQTWTPNSLAVYTGSSLGDLSEIYCRAGGFYDPRLMNLTAGTTYYFQASISTNAAEQIPFSLELTPDPTAGFSWSNPDPTSYENVYFWDQSGDPVCGWNCFQDSFWNMGDGTTLEGTQILHHYLADGDYLVWHRITTIDGRSAETTRIVSVRTHDVSITKFMVPNSANAGQTRTITVGLKNTRYPETVEVQLYKTDATGNWVFIGFLRQYVPVRGGNRTTDFLFSYTFTPEDARVGKVNFRVVANIQGYRDALPPDNEAFSLAVKVGK